MKSVCLVVQNIYDMDVRVRRKAEALVSAGYSVDVLALAAPTHRTNAYTLNGVNVYTLSLGKKRGSFARYLYEYVTFFLWTFLRLLTRRRRYAVVDVNTLPDFLIFAAAPARWRGAKLVLDMVYNPLETLLLRRAKEQGAEVISGLEMFLEQAVRQFEIWTGDSAPRALMERAALEALGGVHDAAAHK